MGVDFEGPPEAERFRICNGLGTVLDSAAHIEEALPKLRAKVKADHILDSWSGATVARKMTRMHSRLLRVVGVA